MRTIVVRQATDAAQRRYLAWCLVRGDGFGFEARRITGEDGVTVVDLDPDTVTWGPVLFTAAARDTAIGDGWT